MNYITKGFLRENIGIKEHIINFVEECEKDLKEEFDKIKIAEEFNQYKVFHSMQNNRLSEIHFNSTTGYGYGDIGRETLDKVYAEIFAGEDAIVRTTITSGTHALTLCLFGILRPNDEILSITGKPYDTLDSIIGIDKQIRGNLKDNNVSYKQVDLTNDGDFDYNLIKKNINSNTKLIFIQRSMGYNQRKSLAIEKIEQGISFIKSINPDVYCMVDNCYGEFVELKEPTEVGADIIAGSLIKNPGGSIAPTGGYIVGKKELVGLAADRLIAPGIGKECGATLGFNRLLFQGLFLAPHIVAESLKGAILCAKIFSNLGFKVSPSYKSKRTDLIQTIEFKNRKSLISFCQGIQQGSPVDSFVVPEPWEMPGYDDEIIMATGGFVQGSSIELSADGPIRPPYTAYLQGGVTYEYVKLGLMHALQKLIEDKCILIGL